MKMVKRYYKAKRRAVARFVWGFENCPPDYQMNFAKKFVAIAAILATGIVSTFGIGFFFLILI